MEKAKTATRYSAEALEPAAPTFIESIASNATG